MEQKIPAPFKFKQFVIHQDQCTMKVGTDGVLLGAWADVEGVSRALDIGTGSGLIAIMLGQRSEKAKIDGVEIEEKAFEQTVQNMKEAPWANRLKAYNISLQDFSKNCTHTYDLIVSNPPFFSGGTFSHNQDRNSVRHTIKLPHGDLLGAARKLLAPHGKLCLILPYIEGLRIQELAQSYNLYCTKETHLRPKASKSVERLLLQFERQEKPVVRDELVIQKENNNEWTDPFMALTKDFYLKM